MIDDDDFTQSLVGNGMPEGVARMMLGLYLASRRGEFAVADPALEQMLGRPAQSIRTVLEGVVAIS